MKKIVVLILLVLPFVLTIMISLMGKIVSLITYIPVEQIMFVNEFEEELDETFKLGKEEVYELNIRILPALSSKKTYVISMAQKYESICAIEDNKITGINYGVAEIIVKSDDNEKVFDRLIIRVSDDYVKSVEINKTSAELRVGESIELTCSVLPITAINKNVVWSSSNTSKVTVTPSGLVNVIEYTSEPIIISATSLQNSEIYSECVINIVTGVTALIFTPLLEDLQVYTLTVDTIDLSTLITFDESRINVSDIHYEIILNEQAGSISGSVLTVTEVNTMFKVVAYVGEDLGGYKTNIYMIRKN